MKPRFFLIILVTFILLGGLALLLSPKPLSPEEEKKAQENRKEILRSQLEKDLPADSTIPDSVLDRRILE